MLNQSKEMNCFKIFIQDTTSIVIFKKKLRKDNAVSVIKALEKHPNVSFVQLKKVLSKRYGEIAAAMAVQDAEFLLRQMKLANIADQEQAMYRSR